MLHKIFQSLFSTRTSSVVGSARCADRTPRRVLSNTIAIATLVSLLLAPARFSLAAVSTDNTNVRVSIRRDHGVWRFFVENAELSEVTMTFVFATKNLKSTVAFPYTATFKPGETEAFTLSRENTNDEWSYSYTNFYKLGSRDATPDDYVYSLPYTPGSTYKVTQGYNGRFSHKGSNQYAIDWQMPEGTPVRAARGGLVVKIKDDSDKGGGSVKYDSYNNYVIIRHDDGTLGHYCHLKKGGVEVHPGQIVKAGDFIALSGNTGFTTGAHLHFSVFKTRDGRERVSIPVKFKDADGEVVTLAEGHKYRAPEIQTALNSGARSSVARQ